MMGSISSASKRHWIATLLAVWMFADALLMLASLGVRVSHLLRFSQPTQQLRVVPSGVPHGYPSRPWVLVTFWSLQNLLPAPHLLITLRGVIVFRFLHQQPTSSIVLNFFLNMLVLGLAVAMGWGLLRMRDWARWSYAGLCILSVVHWMVGGVAVGIFGVARVIFMVVLPIALSVFLLRRDLTVKPRPDSPKSPESTASS